MTAAADRAPIDAGPSPEILSQGFDPRQFPHENQMGDPSVAVDAHELARRLRMTDRAVRDLAARNVMVKLGRGQFDLWASIGNYAEHMRNVVNGRGEHAGGTDLVRERTRETKERADNLALKNAQITGELVEAVKVEREWGDILRGVRARMLAVPSRCRQRLGHLTPHDVAAIDREVRDALTEAGHDNP